MNKIKVVWLCNFSNKDVRFHLKFRRNPIERLFYFLRGKKFEVADYGRWNSNALFYFKTFTDIDLHVISPHALINSKLQEFFFENINYHFFALENEKFIKKFYYRLTQKQCEYDINSEQIVELIEKIQPDIIHCIGAENPVYAKSCLMLSDDKILLTSLQTLMLDPNFFDNYPIDKKSYDFRSSIERAVILRSDYIGTIVKNFRDIIVKDVKPDCKFLDLKLALGEDINIVDSEKKYDFVYFSANINKAVDLAIEAFALAAQINLNITLDIIGAYTVELKSELDDRLKELGIEDRVFFEGHQLTHDDVINKMRNSRFALLPLKIDFISGTIREAMCNGLPVVTTITQGTPLLNENRESVLLSEIGDHKAMADNMLKLVDDIELADKLKVNAVNTVEERYGNKCAMQEWRNCYHKIIEENKNV